MYSNSELQNSPYIPSSCPRIITIRRKWRPKRRTSPDSIVQLGEPLSTPPHISSSELTDVTTPAADPLSMGENLKVFLRIRPLPVQNSGNVKRISMMGKSVWPKPKVKSSPKLTRSSECVKVNDDLCSVTLSPQLPRETKRVKSEVYEGFSRVFCSEAAQVDVYEHMVKPMVDDFVKGRSGLLAAMGPSGSGKTHTVFGSIRDPGMVPLALRDIFSRIGKRKYYLSMMEIKSEQGKNEKFIDLLHDGVDVYMQQSVVKGIQEAVITDAQHAEFLIARGMLKRATATTNSNSQSSRSQCVINIRGVSYNPDGEDDNATSTLTIVDLAGAEKEKKTGNQGSRLLESNFINNTSMVFGLCLRSLLEHQKNRKKPLSKHYHNSLLTRYMRDYLEGKKRMTLILTVKPGMEDYRETSFLLKQASPFANIKFENDCSKRPNQAFPRAEQLKRMKFSNNGASLIDEAESRSGSSIEDCKIHKDRDYQILLGISKAVWTLLKENRKETQVLKAINQNLKDELCEKTRLLALVGDARPVVSCCCHQVTDASPDVSFSGRDDKNYHQQELGHLSVSADDDQDAKCREHSVCTNDDWDYNSSNNMDPVGCESTLLSSACLYNSPKTPNREQLLKLMGDENLDNSESISNELSCPTCVECESFSSPPDDEDLRDDKGTLIQHQSDETDGKHQFGYAAVVLSDNELNTCALPQKDGSSIHVKEEQPITKEDEVNVLPREGRCQSRAQKGELQPAEKPKRRLLPASPLLLKEMSSVDFCDDMPKAAKGGKTGKADDKYRAQGSLSLLRLLKTELDC